MDIKEIRQIIELMNEHELSYFHLEEEGVNLRLKKGANVVNMAQAALPAAGQFVAPPAPANPALPPEPAVVAPTGTEITAPMVGTFYSASSPEADPFVSVGDTISVGQTICIIEAMKVMNEIKAEVAGTVLAISSSDGEPVQFGDVLFRVQ